MNTTMTPPQAEHITLYYREGSSDKVYQARIEPRGELFVVNFAFGRRGTMLQTGTKSSSPVDYQTAKNTFDKLVREKLAKGYTSGPDGTPYQQSENEQRVTGILPQLLNPIEEHQVKRFINDPNWCGQEKFDGKRMLLLKQANQVQGINRKGLVVALPESVVTAAQATPGNFILDGECVGDRLFVFDLLQLGDLDLRREPYQKRLVALMNLLGLVMQRKILLTDTAFTQGQKRDLLNALRRNRQEGIVFKRLDAPYTPGRPPSGGPALKFKFYATVSTVVSKVNPQRSVEVRLLNCKGWVSVGNVTIPVNEPIPEVGSVIEIRYLYAFRESNALFQPVYLGRRKDLEQHECILSQLKYKPEGESFEE